MEALFTSVKNDLMNNDAAAAAARIQRYLRDLEEPHDIPLNIAITGESGSGKSTFVNAFRGIRNGDEGAAPTDVIESLKDPIPYFHPHYPNVTLWDLPGIGTIKFKAHKYLEYVGFEKYDFFIIISDTGHRENDVRLAQEIQKMKKKFYFVRSKIDNFINAERRNQDFSAERSLRKMRRKCVLGLGDQDIESPKVFLVSSFEPHLYDFFLLRQTFEGELPEVRRDSLLFKMANISLEIIRKKKEAFQSKVKYWAGLSGAAAAVPVPGLSVAVDISLMVAVVKDYVADFGLDKSSLENLAENTDVLYADLCAVIRSPLAGGEITADLLIKVLSQLTCTAAFMTIEEGVRWIPLIGIVASAGLSFTVIYKALSYFLNTLADDAQRVFKKALGLN
ncbi:unnamed protein product [Oreochromis niloticus]|nr:unnamed protein product [Mustela putorius furo]